MPLGKVDGDTFLVGYVDNGFRRRSEHDWRQTLNGYRSTHPTDVLCYHTLGPEGKLVPMRHADEEEGRELPKGRFYGRMDNV
jgi:hypothetical protein